MKHIRYECVPCRPFRPKVALQMVEVHRAKFGAGHPPFTFRAVGYFVPIDVVHGRQSAKRWGILSPASLPEWCMWICQNTFGRVFQMLLRRFVSIYRKPDHKFSDNGTNLVGAQRLLREELDKLKGDGVLVIEFKDLGMEWFFQPA